MDLTIKLPAPMLLLLLLAVVVSAQNELLSARCQAKCLADFEQMAEKGLARRQLKHHIISLCKNDVNCSSCATPCRQPYESAQHCLDVHCKDTDSKVDCYRSCQFMSEIYTSKPGSCPKRKFGAEAEECVVSCNRDGDCPHAQKCCSNGCGRSCAVSEGYQHLLLPQPVEVTVTERKRGRSAVVRWVMKQLRPEHGKTYANLYIVQWKWGIKPNGSGMTRWQTISVRNKLYSILKHLLSPGRYYRFRVAAVDKHGSLGFSAESQPFKLSKDPKAPNKPRSLEAGSRTQDGDGTYEQEIRWLEPSSDLPIVSYQVSWSIVDIDFNATTDAPDVITYQNDQPQALTQQRPAGDDAADSFDPDQFQFKSTEGYWSEIIPAERTSVRLSKLERNKTYLVEVHAIVNSETRQMQGDKAMIYVVTAPDSPLFHPIDAPPEFRVVTPPTTTTAVPEISTSTGAQPTGNDLDQADIRPSVADNKLQVDFPSLHNLKVHEAYFHNGLLKAMITWDILKGVDLAESEMRFELKWWPTVCLGGAAPELSLTKELSAVSMITQYELYDLQFSCQYLVNVSVILDGLLNTETSFQTQFETAHCQDTPVRGDVTPTCPTLPPDVPSRALDLDCQVNTSPVTRQRRTTALQALPNITAVCSWTPPQSSDKPIIGYRVISGERLLHNLGIADSQPFASIDRNTVQIKVHKADVHMMRMPSLAPDTQYVVQVQAISSIGLGEAAHYSFRTPTLTALNRLDTNLIGEPSDADALELHYQTHDVGLESDQLSAAACPTVFPTYLLLLSTIFVLLFAR